DLAGIDLTGTEADLSGADLASADMTQIDMSVAIDMTMTCSSHGDCSGATPLCDSTTKLCRACTGAADDTLCMARDPLTPFCKIDNPNKGLCVQCNTSATCAAATPYCTPEGVCRKCHANGECGSTVCDLTSAGTNGTCVDASNIVYVDNVKCLTAPAMPNDG